MKLDREKTSAIPLEAERAPESATAAIHGTRQPSNIFTRMIAAGEWLLFAVLAAYMAAHTLPRAWRTLNTDFPNYYLTAHLLHEGDDTSRVYEWIWIQRQKDHRAIDQPIVGMVPITPFSTLAVWPLSSLPPLTAKRCWLALMLAMLAATLVLLQSMTALAWRKILLVAALCLPLRTNFVFGQYYVLLLLVLTLACWLHLRQRRFWAGIMIGLAFGLKIFPILYLLYFLRKRDWKAFAGGVLGSVAVAGASIAAFGWALNRTYIAQVLPWALRGEAMDPYNLQAASISSLLHRLFIYEPQRNPHPALNAPWLLVVLLPLLQLVVFAPALLLATPGYAGSRKVRLEWAALLLACLAISTSPASYDFTLLILPICFLWDALQSQKNYSAIALLLFLYVAVGHPAWKATTDAGWLALLGVPRLYAVLLLCLFSYVLLWRQRNHAERSARDQWMWPAALSCGLLLSIAFGLRHQHGLYRDYLWRLPAPKEMYLSTRPVVDGNSVLFTAMLLDGYRTGEENNGSVRFLAGGVDQLAVATGNGRRWIEEGLEKSRIVSTGQNRMKIDDAEAPVASSDGKLLAFLREDHGRARIWVRILHRPSEDRPITPSGMNVLEMSFLPKDGLVFAVTSANGLPELFAVDRTSTVSRLIAEDARYPAVSPDGKWLAYSRLQRGNWHLWIRDMHTGETRRITDADCNNVWPTWEADSKTLVYASDCGRALWFTALCRRRVLP